MFRLPTELDELRRPDFWRTVLGAAPEFVVSRFLACGFVTDRGVEVATLLQLKSKDELKSLAKSRGISQSGTKEVLAKKLFKANPSEMSGLFRGKRYITCTPKGQLLVEKLQESERELRLEAESQSESALRAGSHKDACTIVANFEASQVFQRGLGIDWSNYDAAHDIEILNEIANYSSPRHRHIPENILSSLRISAGMMNLWGENNPLKWLTDSEQKFAPEARMILHAAIEKVRLKELRRAGIPRVKILSSGRDDVCNTCKKANGETYPRQSAPELPDSQCTCPYGCPCTLIAV